MIYIVSVTYNDVDNLKRTFESVRVHKLCYQKYVVIDGGSTDGTLDLCRDNSDIIDYMISEPDRGIYDAMNKVLRISEIKDDDYIIWINGGDELIAWPHNLETMLQGYAGAFFNVYLGMVGEDRFRLASVNILTPYNEYNFSPKSVFFHQGFFIKCSTFRQEQYDITVGVQAENLLMSRLIMNNLFYVSQIPVARFFFGGVSSHHKEVFFSWIKVAQALEFSWYRLLIGQRMYILKQVLKLCLPETLVFCVFMRKQKKLLYLEGI